MEAWSRCSPKEQVTTDSCGISSQRVDNILFYSTLAKISVLRQAPVPGQPLMGLMEYDLEGHEVGTFNKF